MFKLGIILDHLGPAQLPFCFINAANDFLEKNSQGIDVVAFVQNLTPLSAQPNFARMNTAEAFDYNGHLIATNLKQAWSAIKFPGTRQKYLYVWDLEWVRGQNKNFPFLSDVYQNPAIELIARSKPHKDIIELCWNRPVLGIVEDGRLDQFYDLLKDRK